LLFAGFGFSIESAAQSLVPSIYTEAFGANYFGYFKNTFPGYFSLNALISFEKQSCRVHPQVSLGYGIVANSFLDEQNFFPVGVGVAFGKRSLRIKPAFYMTPVWVKYYHQQTRKVLFCYTGEIVLQWYCVKDFYIHAGLVYKFMPDDPIKKLAPYYFSYDFRSGFFRPSVALGYTFKIKKRADEKK
jgi:hypothetical protein